MFLNYIDIVVIFAKQQMTKSTTFKFMIFIRIVLLILLHIIRISLEYRTGNNIEIITT